MNDLDEKLTNTLNGAYMALTNTEHEGAEFSAYARGVMIGTFREMSQLTQLNAEQQVLCKSIAQLLDFQDGGDYIESLPELPK